MEKEMKDYEKERKRKIKEDKDIKKGDRKALFAFVALAAAIVLFVVLTIIQNNIVNKVEQKGVVVAIADVPKGIMLTEESIKQYFDVEMRNSSDVPAGYYTSGHPLVGMITGRDIVKKEIVTPGCIVAENIYEGIEDPVELSIEVGKIGQAVGGSLRAGDRIDIKVVVNMTHSQKQDSYTDVGEGDFQLEDVPPMDYDVPEIEYTEESSAEDTPTDDVFTDEMNEDVTVITPDNAEEFGAEEVFDLFADIMGAMINTNNYVWSATGRYASVPVCENVRVINAYNSAGVDTATAVEMGETPVANIITVVVPRSMQDVIALAMEEGTLRISRIIDVPAPVENDSNETVSEETVAGEAAEESSDTEASAETR